MARTHLPGRRARQRRAGVVAGIFGAGCLAAPPRAIVVDAGDNDLAAGTGQDAMRVSAEAESFVRMVHDALPEAVVYFLSIKPSPLRWERWPEVVRANEGLARLAEDAPRVHYIDLGTPLLGADGTPRSELFWIDGLHADGYAAWTQVLRPILMAAHGSR